MAQGMALCCTGASIYGPMLCIRHHNTALYTELYRTHAELYLVKFAMLSQVRGMVRYEYETNTVFTLDVYPGLAWAGTVTTPV